MVGLISSHTEHAHLTHTRLATKSTDELIQALFDIAVLVGEASEGEVPGNVGERCE